MPAPTPHTCMCRNCHPELFPKGPPQGEGHVAVRFGRRDYLATVHLDGVELKDCDEALPGAGGEDGLVVRANLPPHYCCKPSESLYVNDGYCVRVERGNVRVSMTLDK